MVSMGSVYSWSLPISVLRIDWAAKCLCAELHTDFTLVYWVDSYRDMVRVLDVIEFGRTFKVWIDSLKQCLSFWYYILLVR